jgi:hypothetical protein
MFSSFPLFSGYIPPFVSRVVNFLKTSDDKSCECSCKCNVKHEEVFKNIRVFKPKIINENAKSLLFFSGANSFVSHELYSDFLNKLSNSGLYIYVIPFQYNHFDILLDILKKQHEEIIPISHSSGFSTLVEKVSDKDFIEKAVFLDPVNLNIKPENKITMKFLKNILFLRAEKSYQGKVIPFIPDFLEINNDKIKINNDCKVKTINTEEYGHCDLLNPLFSNMVHSYFKIICDSSDNRKPESLESYIDWLVSTIHEFVQAV